MPKKNGRTRIRGLGKNVLVSDLRQVLAGTTLGPKLSPKEVELLFKLTMATLRSRIANRDRIAISGFGSFFIGDRKGRMMTQSDGKKISVPDYRVVRFKPSGMFRQVVNGKAILPILTIPENLRIVAAPKRRKAKPAAKPAADGAAPAAPRRGRPPKNATPAAK